jgi:hypothetical protein
MKHETWGESSWILETWVGMPLCLFLWRTPKLLIRLKLEFEGENNGRKKSANTLPSSQHFGCRGPCLSFRMGTRTMTSGSIIPTDLYKPTISWLMHNWNTFNARTHHEHTRTHKTHHGPDLYKSTTLPLIIFFMIHHGGYIQMSFCPRFPSWESRNFRN